MTQKEAKTFGRAKALKATGIVATALLIVLMFKETSSDFANGILFFMQDILNIHFIIILALLFGLTFLFGGKAGKEIIIDKKNFVAISIRYAVLIILTITTYAAIIGIASDNDTSKNFQKLLTTYFLNPLAKMASLLIIPMLAIWLWATNQMRLADIKKIE